MIRQFAARIVRAVQWRVARVRGNLKVASGFGREEVMAFWRQHGAEWAREDACPNDLTRVADLVAAVEDLSEKEAASRIAARFREVWETGFSSSADAFGWTEMNDRLPDVALLSFARGAAEEYRLRQGS